MKNEKFCFNKSVGVIILVVMVLGAFAFGALQLTQKSTSTSTRAAGVNPVISGIQQRKGIPNWTQLLGGFPYALRLSKSDIMANSQKFTAINPLTDEYFYNNLNKYSFKRIINSSSTESDQQDNRNMGFFILDIEGYNSYINNDGKDDPKSVPCYTSSNSIESIGFFNKKSLCQGKQIKIYQNIISSGIYLTLFKTPQSNALYLLDRPTFDGIIIDKNTVYSYYIPYEKEILISIDSTSDFKSFTNRDITILPIPTPTKSSRR